MPINPQINPQISILTKLKIIKRGLSKIKLSTNPQG